MRKRLIFSFLMAVSTGLALAQADDTNVKFFAETNQTEVLLGNYVEVAFVLENGQGGRFSAPDWEAAGLELRAGPSQSSNFSMINGRSTSSVRYTYFVQPRDTGLVVIPPATIKTSDGELSTEPLTLRVLPNPDGIIETPQQEETFDIWGRQRPAPAPAPPAPSKKKRATVRI